MSAPQRQFLSSRPLAALRAELQRWTAEPVDPPGLLEHLERYERTGLPSDAGLLAADCRHLVLDAGGAGQQLAERLEANYRNANLRVTVTKELLDRLMPEREPEYAPVHDTVLGRPVNGRSVTFTQVGVQLLPDPDRLRLALEISGEVESLTSSTAGPATFYNDSTSTYTALKPLEIDLNGIRLSPTEVEVDSRTRIRDLQTDFDEIPLLGGLVQKIARSQHDQKQGAATREVKQKISREAQQRIDSEIEDRVGEVSDRLQKRVLDPLEAAGLAPAIIDRETTDQRLTIRMRLAGEDQLGGHTPRPQAPSDSLASLQVHESAINNMLQRLELEGRTFTLPKLSEHVTARLGCSPIWEIDPEHEDVTITFAKQDAVGVRLQDGRALLRLAIAKLSKSPQTWRDFEAYVRYRPEVDGRSAMLVRDGNVQLGGGRMATGAQIALRGIFAKVFSSRRAWNLTPEQLATDERLADLEVTQLTIDDGWIGVALGPQRTVVHSAMLRP